MLSLAALAPVIQLPPLYLAAPRLLRRYLAAPLGPHRRRRHRLVLQSRLAIRHKLMLAQSYPLLLPFVDVLP
jgi:hypothetical protein